LDMVDVESDILVKAQLTNHANETLFSAWKKILDKRVEEYLSQMEGVLGYQPFLDMVVEVREFLKAAGDNEFTNKHSLVKKNQFILPYLQKAVNNWTTALLKFPKDECSKLLRACDQAVGVLEVCQATSNKNKAGISDNIDRLIWRIKFTKAELLVAYSFDSPNKTISKWTPSFVYNGAKKLSHVVHDPSLDFKTTIKENLEKLNSPSVNLKTVEQEYSAFIKELYSSRENTHDLIIEHFPSLASLSM
jgi:hypothetical protein